MKMPILLGLGFSLGLAVACTGPKDGPSNAEACRMIIDACHPKDDGKDEMINGCHLLAHEESPECVERLDACLDACNAHPGFGDTGTDGGNATGSGTTGGADGTTSDDTSQATTGSQGSSGGPSDGTTSDGTTGGSDGTTTGTEDACGAYCDCMEATCIDVPGNPFASQQACLDACEAFDAAEIDCFSMWCGEATNNPGLLDHLCEHAWGDHGLSECG